MNSSSRRLLLTDRETEQGEAGNDGKSKKIREGIISDGKNFGEKKSKMAEYGKGRCIMCDSATVPTPLQIVKDGCERKCLCGCVCAPCNRKREKRRNGTRLGLLYPWIIELSQCFDSGH